MNQNYIERSLLYLFPVLIVICFVEALGLSFSYIPWFFSFYYVIIGFISLTNIKWHNAIKLIFLIWVLYIFISGITSQLPPVFFTEEFKRFIAPTMFFFVGMYVESDDIYKYFLYVVFISVVIGFVLLVFQPAWYTSFLMECFNNHWYSAGNENANSIVKTAYRFQSFFSDAYAISYFVTFALCIVMCDIYKKKKYISSVQKTLVILLALVLSIVLSGFRVALTYLALVFVWMMIYGIKTHNPQKRVFVSGVVFITLFVVVVFTAMSNNTYISFLTKTLSDRFSDMSYETVMEGSRNYQQELVLNSWSNYMFGDGTGSKGAQARIAGLPAITDGGYVKMLVENGIIGFSLFAIIILSTLLRGISHLKYFMMEILIIGYVLLSLLGANSLAMSWYYVLIFWFALGRIWNDYILNKRIRNSEEI